jgi:putative heme-binding domain-containing protein
MIYLGDQFPAAYRGLLMTCNIHGNRVNCDSLRLQGSGFVGEHRDDLLLANDPWFRGLESIYGPDGGVFVSDWTDFGECHDNDGVHRTSGRIYKVTYGEPPRIAADLDLAALTDAELIELQSHANEWYPRMARRILQHRASTGMSIDPSIALQRLNDESLDATLRLRYLWTLHVTGNLPQKTLLALSQLDSNPQHDPLRCWSVRLMVDAVSLDEATADRLVAMSAEVNAGLTMLHLASALPKLDAERRFGLATQLALAAWSNEDLKNDQPLRMMIWYGIEPSICDHHETAIQLASQPIAPEIRQFIARRLVDDPQQNHLPQLVAALTQISSAAIRHDWIVGMHAGLQSYTVVAKPAKWELLMQQLASADEHTLFLATEIGFQMGDKLAQQRLQEIAMQKIATQDDSLAQQAIQRLAASQVPGFDQGLIQLIAKPSPARVAAIIALASYQNPETADRLLAEYSSFEDAEQQAAIATLAVNAETAVKLLQQVEAGKIPSIDVSAFTVRQIRAMKRKELDSIIDRIWPVTRSTDDQQAQIKKYKAILGETYLTEKYRAGDGRAIFDKVCAQCHKMSGKGGELGPELTGSGRKDLDYILQNVIDPSAMVQQAYRMSIVETSSGKTYSGIIVEENDQWLKMRTPERELVVQRSEIESVEHSDVSIMPTGIFDQLTPEQIRLLVAYLSQ